MEVMQQTEPVSPMDHDHFDEQQQVESNQLTHEVAVGDDEHTIEVNSSAQHMNGTKDDASEYWLSTW